MLPWQPNKMATGHKTYKLGRRQKVITIAHPEHSSGELKTPTQDIFNEYQQHKFSWTNKKYQCFWLKKLPYLEL